MNRKWALLALAFVIAATVAVFVLGSGAAARPLHLSTTGTRYAVTVEIDDPAPGRIPVEVVVTSGDADTVALSSVMVEMGHSTPEILAREGEPGHFLAEGELFAMSGVWELSIRLDGPAGEEQLAVKALITD